MSVSDEAPEWRPAVRRDQAQINSFVCTEPKKAVRSRATGWQLSHPRLYEYDAQQMIRALRVPARGREATWVMEDGEGIAAVSHWTALDEPGYAHLDVVGVAMRHRRWRSDLGFRLIAGTLAEIEARAIEDGALEMYVECEIFSQNVCSQRMVQRFGMTMISEARRARRRGHCAFR